MNKEKIIKQITLKKEFSQLPEMDVRLAFDKFERRQVSDEEKIRLTRELLHKVFGAFTSKKLLSPKNKSEDWILRKHISTRERLPYYSEIYKRILSEYKNKKVSIIDFGAGVNGFSYKYFQDLNVKVDYLGIEAVGQLVDLMNDYFLKEKLNAVAIHEGLFNLDKIKKIIGKTEKPRVVFLFKVLDSLEMLEEDYSKKLLKEVLQFADKIVVSFATRSMSARKKFYAKRNWILNFIQTNFEVLEDFEIGGERYISFRVK